MQRPDHGQAVSGLASDLSTEGRLLTGAPRLSAELPLGWRRRGRGVERPQPSPLPSSRRSPPVPTRPWTTVFRFGPEGCQNPGSSGCGSVVLVQETAEVVAALDGAARR